MIKPARGRAGFDYPRGLTALDSLDEDTLGTRPNLAHVTARQEVMGLLAALKLPIDERGRRRAAARVEWFSAQDRPLETHDLLDTSIPGTRRRVVPRPLRGVAPGATLWRGRGRPECLSMAQRPGDKTSDKTPVSDKRPVSAGNNMPAANSSRSEIDAFVAQVKTLAPTTAVSGRGRLIFALDATMSRQPTWDTACRLQADMFRTASAIGGLDVQLVYYRGLSECRSSSWVSEAARLAGLMERIDCRAGNTQIGKVLAHARRETGKSKVQALVFVGDAMEEKIDKLGAQAGELGLLGVPAFMFQEGYDSTVEQAFREIARLTRGAYCRFDPGAAHQLGELLRAAAAYAAGGMRALADLSARRDAGAIKLIEQMRQR